MTVKTYQVESSHAKRHSEGAILAAQVIVGDTYPADGCFHSGMKKIPTCYGTKTVVGIADLIDINTKPAGSHATMAAEIAELRAVNKELLEVAEICREGVIERRETGKPTWTAFDHMQALARAAIARAAGGG